MKTSTKLLSVPFALALGLGGASAYAYSIANAHIMPYRGGNGGNHYAVSCPQGSVAVGAYGRSGAYVDRLGLICRRVMPNGNLGATLRTAAAGGGGGAPFQIECGANRALMGFYGKSGSYLDQIGLVCAGFRTWTLGAPATQRGPNVGGGGGDFFTDQCPRASFVTSLVGRSGAYVDAQVGVCSRAFR